MAPDVVADVVLGIRALYRIVTNAGVSSGRNMGSESCASDDKREDGHRGSPRLLTPTIAVVDADRDSRARRS
jgi:hypothetical protein